eukprot:TRINITY_DN16837_c0_g1_i1.p1 TRINITY_DN16837_c0_g1~~TRINITY_DN16837_c0_g1_i1.p1  ORF type:complete len:547 (+),score=96.29 TRINITY_DN16837_c0_g1_i1:51-1691(+)
MHSLAHSVLALLAAVPACMGASGNNLWSMGNIVDENPVTVFFMFAFSVCLVIAIMGLKQYVERKTKDAYRRKALDSFYVELMLVGVISFLLIISAELGLTSLRIEIGCDDDDTTANESSTSSSSGCGYGFDLLMFEYAHLVLFIMGLTYGVFIQICFWYRKMVCRNFQEIQSKTLGEYLKNGGSRKICSPFGAIGLNKQGWARTVLIMRSIVALQHKDLLKKACNKKEHQLEHAIAVLEKEKPPADFPDPEEALVRFDFAKLIEIAMAEVLLEMLHVSPFVWISLMFIASANLLHKAGVELSQAITATAFIGPFVSVVVMWRLIVHLFLIVKRGCGHPSLPSIQFYSSEGSRPYTLPIPEKYVHSGLSWATGGPAPWDIITGCIPDHSRFNFLDILDAGNIKTFIQASIMMLCFYYGQLAMLSSMIGAESGGLVIVLYLMPVPSLALVLPHSILMFTMVHRLRDPPVHWIKYALREPEEENEESERDKVSTQSEEEELQVTINSITPARVPRRHRPTLIHQAGVSSMFSESGSPNGRRARAHTLIS